jgi:hypothetical protein
MRCVSLIPAGQRVLAAGTALLVTLVGCSSEAGPPQDTTVVFDGQTYTISAPVKCAMTRHGRLAINANTERGKKLISMSLTRDPPLVVATVGFRHFNVRGFTNNPNEVFATKADNTYTISGRMPPEEGETAWHQFKIDVTCLQIEEFTSVPRTSPAVRDFPYDPVTDVGDSVRARPRVPENVRRLGPTQ